MATANVTNIDRSVFKGTAQILRFPGRIHGPQTERDSVISSVMARAATIIGQPIPREMASMLADRIIAAPARATPC